MVASRTSGQTPGVGVDAHGGAVIDPTANVLALVEAQAKSAEALRAADIRFNEMQHAYLKDIGDLRARHAEALTIAESKRIDAIRAVDVGAVATAAERAGQQATVLANQVGTSAETLRTLVASTATTMANAAAQFQTQVTERLALLERSQYKGEGRSGIAEPQTERLALLVEKLVTAQAAGSGKTEGASNMWGYVVGGVGFLVMVLSGVAGIITFIVSKSPAP